MAEEPLANKSQPPSELPDAEYNVIFATVSETAQGRRFLQEYARRCRPSDTENSLAAIERMQAVIRAGGASERMEILLEMADMAQAIVRLRAEILAMRPPGGGPLEATEELDSIVQTTECATSRILAAAEQVQEIAWTMRESGSIEALCDELDLQATEIYTACTFQDLTGQRTRKVIEVLRYLEDRINAMVTARDKKTAGKAPAAERASSGSLQQADVDAVMLPETSAHDDRQDATLEDIGRVMLAIEPTIGLQQTGAANTQASEDVRPELSVAETVMEEIHSAHPLADWAVDPALAPAKPAAESAPMADWVVEDPAAPRPDSEPAWMILRRLEAELDEQMDAPAAAVPASRLKAEPRLFPAEAMAQLAQQLQPNSLLPPAELFRPSPHTIVPIAELETAMAAAEVKLLLPDDDAGQPEPIPPAVVTNAPAPASPDRMKRGANTVTNARAAVVDARPPRTPRAEADVDDFLFAPDQRPEARRRDPVTPKAGSEASVPPAERQWEGGTFPDPALVTPKTLPPVEAEAEQPKSDGSHDPLAPLRAMSDAEKIALFS